MGLGGLFDGLAEAEVSDFAGEGLVFFLFQQNVLALDVPVNHAGLVNVVDALYDLHKNAQGVLEFEDFVGLGELVGVQVAQLTVLHD